MSSEADTLTDSRAWRRAGPKHKVRIALRLIRELGARNESLQRQVSHAARATGEMASRSRALEVQAAARNIEAQGQRVFGDVKAVVIATPPLSPSTRQLIDSQPKELAP